MRPFEFLIESRPVSQQARRRSRLKEWKETVRREANLAWTAEHERARNSVCITIVYLYQEVALDADNVIKPIQDALVGLVFDDDAIVTDAISRKRHLGGSFNLTSAVLARGFETGGEFVYVRVADAPPQGELT